MKLSERFNRIISEKRLVTLILMLACGAALVLMSYRMKETPQTERAQDVAYAAGSIEERLSQVLSMIEGAGKAEVLVTQGETGVVGVLVVADGAQDLTVRTELMRAAMTALDIPAESVEVFVRKKEGDVN